MGRIIPKNNPKYDRTLDVDTVVAASAAAVADALTHGINAKNIQVEEQTANSILFSGKSAVGVKNIWILVEFSGPTDEVRVTSRITKAHTAGWIHLFGIPIGPVSVRGISTYKALSPIWRSNLASLGVVGAPVR